MRKSLVCIVVALLGVTVSGQNERTTSGALSASKSNQTPAGSLPVLKNGPMEITATTEASYEDQARKAVFLGSVQVKNSEFTLSAEKLTVFFKKGAAQTKASGAADPQQAELAKQFSGGGLEKVVAEGKVVITRVVAGTKGAEPTRYRGQAERVEYDAQSGDVTLSGWPKVQQGINTHFATDASTVMIMNRAGSMRTKGPSKTDIEDTGQDKKL